MDVPPSPPSAAGVTLPLLRLSGACAGTELRLASDSVPFGPVVLGSRALKRLTLENTGDLGTRFEWDKAALGEHFSISPATGFLVREGGAPGGGRGGGAWPAFFWRPLCV